MEDDKLYWPKCGSSQLVANKKGFGVGKAITGAILTGGVGLLAGFLGSGKIKVTCLRCGHKCDAGSLRTTPLPKPTAIQTKSTDGENDGCLGVIILALVFIFFIVMFSL